MLEKIKAMLIATKELCLEVNAWEAKYVCVKDSSIEFMANHV
jgi:hypothetical protein